MSRFRISLSRSEIDLIADGLRNEIQLAERVVEGHARPSGSDPEGGVEFDIAFVEMQIVRRRAIYNLIDRLDASVSQAEQGSDDDRG